MPVNGAGNSSTLRACHSLSSTRSRNGGSHQIIHLCWEVKADATSTPATAKGQLFFYNLARLTPNPHQALINHATRMAKKPSDFTDPVFRQGASIRAAAPAASTASPDWNIPEGYLARRPGRADLIHAIADLWVKATMVTSPAPGADWPGHRTGANPGLSLIGQTRVSNGNLSAAILTGRTGYAERNPAANAKLQGPITLRKQANPTPSFKGIVGADRAV